MRTAPGASIALAFAFTLLASAGTASAFDEVRGIYEPINEATCGSCHQPYPAEVFGQIGVHGGFTTTTHKCEQCHSVHVATAGGAKLLRGATIEASCETCHDGTGGQGVYGTIAARTGAPAASGHSCETTDLIPGGSADDGGDASRVFRGEDGSLTCSDCHSPHGANVVDAFQGERRRGDGGFPGRFSTKLLKQTPTGAAGSTAVYGSDWCLGCHEGRSGALSAVHNHPVDEVTSSTPDPFDYGGVAVLASDEPTGVTVIGEMGETNRGYLMPYPRTAQQAGHAPICMQCHEDARNAGSLSADGATADAEPFANTGRDGLVESDNPRFTNFPHETANDSMLVEENDGLCMNCHPPEGLP